jgi:L-iditol 2-dehydrogenase
MVFPAEAAKPGKSELMKAHVLVRPGQLELRDLPMPVPDDDGIVVRIRAALTCGTDLKTFLRGHPKFEMPMLFGHEFAGEVAAVGAKVRGLREGDAIMAAPTAPCGRCYYCVRQQENLCPEVMPNMVHGAYAEFIKLPGAVVRANLFAKPADLPFREAALMEPLACVEHGLSFAAPRADDTAVLIGGGAITLLHLLALRARGCQRVVVVARNPRRAEEARRFGASEVLSCDVRDARAAVLDLTAGRGADLVVECTGQVDVWEAAPALSRIGGRVVLFGGCAAGSMVRFDAGRLHYDQVQIVSPFHFTPRDVRRAFELLASGTLAGEQLIAGELPLAELPLALDKLRGGGGPKYAIVPDDR